MRIIASKRLERALIEAGFVPPDCRLIDIVMAVDAVPVIRYEVFVTRERAAQLARVFTVVAEEE